MSKQQQFVDDELYLPEISESGTNAYYLDGCPVTGHRPAYCACLKKIADRRFGRLDAQYAECSAAIGRKECKAQKMRERELKEGAALFYVNRKKLGEFFARQEKEGAERIVAPRHGRKSEYRPSIPVAASQQNHTPAPAPAVESDGYAAAINRAIAEEFKKSAVPTKPQAPVETGAVRLKAPTPVVPAMKAGMSLLEIARLHAATRVA